MVGIEDEEPQSLTQQFHAEIREHGLATEYPFLSSGWDEGQIHSIGLSYYVLLGQRLGFHSVVDARIFDEKLRKLTTGDTRKNTAPIADSVWYDPDDHRARVAVEFQDETATTEDGRNKTVVKAENLIESAEMEPSIDLLILHHWGKGHGKTSEDVRSRFRSGFTTDQGIPYSAPNADVLVLRSEFTRSDVGDHVAFRQTDVTARFY